MKFMKTITLAVLLLAGSALAGSKLILDESHGLTEKVEIQSYDGETQTVKVKTATGTVSQPLSSFPDSAQKEILAWVADGIFESSSKLRIRIDEEVVEKELEHGDKKYVTYVTTLENCGSVPVNDVEVIAVIFVERKKDSSKSKVRGFIRQTVSIGAGESVERKSLVAEIRDYVVPGTSREIDQGDYVDVWSTPRESYEDTLKGFRLILTKTNRTGENIERSHEDGHPPKTDEDRRKYSGISSSRASSFFSYRSGFMTSELWGKCQQLGLYEPLFESIYDHVRRKKWEQVQAGTKWIRSMVSKKNDAGDAVNEMLAELDSLIEKHHSQLIISSNESAPQEEAHVSEEGRLVSRIFTVGQQKRTYEAYDPQKGMVLLKNASEIIEQPFNAFDEVDQDRICELHLDEAFGSAFRVSINEKRRDIQHKLFRTKYSVYEVEFRNHLDMDIKNVDVECVCFYELSKGMGDYKCRSKQLAALDFDSGGTQRVIVEPVAKRDGYYGNQIRLKGLRVFVRRVDCKGDMQEKIFEEGAPPQKSRSEYELIE